MGKGLEGLLGFFGKNRTLTGIAIAAATVAGSVWAYELIKNSKRYTHIRQIHDRVASYLSSGRGRDNQGVAEYSPNVILTYKVPPKVEDWLLRNGYGIVRYVDNNGENHPIPDRESVKEALKSIPPRIVLTGDPQLTVRDIPVIQQDFSELEKISFSELKRRVHGAIRMSNHEAFQAVQTLASYAEQKTSTEQPPPEIESAIRQLTGRRIFIVKTDTQYAYRPRSVLAFLFSGAPINERVLYRDGVGAACLKIEKADDIPKIQEDLGLFSTASDQVAELADVLFIVPYDRSTRIVGRKYFIGPNGARVASMFLDPKNGMDPEAATRAVDNTIRAFLNVIAKYNRDQRKINPPTDSDREKVRRYYYEGTTGAYNNLRPVLEQIGFPRDRFMRLASLVNQPQSYKGNWVVQVFDYNPANCKLKIGIVDPDFELLKCIYFGNAKGGLISVDALESNLGVYDQGYEYRNVANAAGSLILSPNLVKPGNRSIGTDYVHYSKMVFDTELEFLDSRFKAFSFVPDGFEEISATMHADKAFRFVDYSVSAAMREIRSRLLGRTWEHEYERWKSHLDNAVVYASNLALVGLTGAFYFERYDGGRRRRNPEMWEGIKEANSDAVNLLAQYADAPGLPPCEFSHPLSKSLWEYAELGHSLSNSSGLLQNHIVANATRGMQFQVQYKRVAHRKPA